MHKYRALADARLRVEGTGFGSPSTQPVAQVVLDALDIEELENPGATMAAKSKIIDQKIRPSSRNYSSADNIYECLRHKFQRKLVNLKNAFALFDTQNDGCLTTSDFRRVLTEYCSNLKAAQFPALIARIGQTINNGMVSYTEFLKKLNNKLDPLVRYFIEDNIQRLVRHTFDHVYSDNEVDSFLRRFIENLHREYIYMTATLMRMDDDSQCVLKPLEMSSVIERWLAMPMTERQWRDLQPKLPYDSYGFIRYMDFMHSFD